MLTLESYTARYSHGRRCQRCHQLARTGALLREDGKKGILFYCSDCRRLLFGGDN